MVGYTKLEFVVAKKPSKKPRSSASPSSATTRSAQATVRGEKTYEDQAAEEAFLCLPGPLDETLAIVRYTGRKRIYIHFGVASDEPFFYLIFSDGRRILSVFPSEKREDCFTDLVGMLQGWIGGVNSDPMSPSYCHVCPDPEMISMIIRTRYLNSQDA